MKKLRINEDKKEKCLKSKKGFVWVAVMAGFMILFSTLVSADISEIAKIMAGDGEADDRFGRSVSISSDGNSAIIGAQLEATGGYGAGAAYIFRRDGITWIEQAKILASDKDVTDYFSMSVSISSDGNRAIIGAHSEDTGGANAGAAYIFKWNGTNWTQQAKIMAGDAQASDSFGYSVSISSDGNTAIVGAYNEGTDGNLTGAAYIFKWNGTNWTQQAKIQASDKEAGDFFGGSVSISFDGNSAIIGAQYEDTGGNAAGAAYIFRWDNATWIEQAKIQADNNQELDFFGYSVSISSDGNRAIVAAYKEDEGGTDAGAAYIFKWNGINWTQQAKIMAGDAQASDSFGMSVSISSDGNSAIVGARNEDTGGTNAGAAYIFKWNGINWTEQDKIMAGDAQASDYFGHSVSISSDGNSAIVGAYNEGTDGNLIGAAYIFQSTASSQLPTYTIFTSTTSTNFSAEDNLTSVPNLTLAIDGKGKIRFPSDHNINAENADYDTNIDIGDAVIYVNSAALDSSFNNSATLTFYSVDCSMPYVYFSEIASTRSAILLENNLCFPPRCTNIQCSAGTLTVDVIHFSGYAVNGTANLTIDADDPKYPLELVTFTAEYMNSTGLIEGATCTISIPDGDHAMNELASHIYNYSTTFATAQTVDYNVTCSHPNENIVFANDTAVIQPVDIPEFSTITLVLGFIAVLIGLIIFRWKR